jgi:hypothetical protein
MRRVTDYDLAVEDPGPRNWKLEETPLINGTFVTEIGCTMKVGLTLRFEF